MKNHDNKTFNRIRTNVVQRKVNQTETKVFKNIWTTLISQNIQNISHYKTEGLFRRNVLVRSKNNYIKWLESINTYVKTLLIENLCFYGGSR
jgi:hypothetical protein